MQTAFKEWAVIVDALAQGEQIIVLRKGGISEGKGGFQVDHPSFFLFPTLYHQQRESVLPPAQSRYDAWAEALSNPDQVPIEFYAKVVDWKKIEDLEAARQLRGQHIWKDDVIEQRFDWGHDKGIFALALRIHKISLHRLPMIDAYGGCKSWIELEKDMATEPSHPVLDDLTFEEKLKQFQTALHTSEKP